MLTQAKMFFALAQPNFGAPPLGDVEGDRMTELAGIFGGRGEVDETFRTVGARQFQLAALPPPAAEHAFEHGGEDRPGRRCQKISEVLSDDFRMPVLQ